MAISAVSRPERLLRAGKKLAFLLLVAELSCQGSWADQTVVHLKPVGKGVIKGIAIVSIGRACDDQGHCRYQGSTIDTQLTTGKPKAPYRIVLGLGDCTQPPSQGIELARGNGEMLEAGGTSAHVDIPVSPLTGGSYVVVIEAAERAAVACGIIRRTGWW